MINPLTGKRVELPDGYRRLQDYEVIARGDLVFGAASDKWMITGNPGVRVGDVLSKLVIAYATKDKP